MLFLLLKMASSLTIALMLKFSERRGGNRIVVAGANYIVATLLGLALSDSAASSLPPAWIVFGALVGVGFVAGFLVLMRSFKALGLAVPASVARIAKLGPVLGAVLVFGEMPTGTQLLGIGIGLVAFVLLGIVQRAPATAGKPFLLDTSALWLLLAILLVMSFNDFSMKIAQEAALDSGAFLFYVFGSAGLICWGTVVATRVRPQRSDILLGGLLGIPNYFSSYFLIYALRELPASVVFPIASAGGALLTTAAAVAFWKERPNRPAWIGIGLAAIAVAALGLGD